MVIQHVYVRPDGFSIYPMSIELPLRFLCQTGHESCFFDILPTPRESVATTVVIRGTFENVPLSAVKMKTLCS